MPISMPDSEVRAGKHFGADVYTLTAHSRMTLEASSGDGVATYAHYAQGITDR